MPPKLTDYERERQTNIEKNRALLQELKLDDGPAALGFVPVNPTKGKGKASARDGAKPVQPRKSAGKKRKSRGGGGGKDGEDDEDEDDSEEEVISRRMSTRRGRKSLIDPNETPEQKAAREKEEEARAAREEQERLDRDELARKAREPRHDELELSKVLEDGSDAEEGREGEGKDRTALLVQLGELCNDAYPRACADGERVKATEKDRMKAEMAKMKVVARAKVTTDRIYSMAYHPEKTKDILFFGDKHGQLGIWDARAAAPEDEDDEENKDTKENGKYWRLQLHWPATSKSSISNVKFDPVDAHSVYTSSYDCTIRRTSFTSGISTELFALDDMLISAFDFTKNGHELWISDTKGGVTHLDMREDRHEARRFQLSVKEKIGCVSLNPVDDWSLLASCNDRSLKLWDTRKLMAMPTQERESSVNRSSALVEPYEVDYDDVTEWMKDKKDGKPATLRGTWMHGFSVSSAYWDPSGTRILSTCYDDHLRVWDLPRKYLLPDEPLKSFRPAVSLNHDCQTGRWLTVFKAQWNQNPDVYPYFSVGDMRHSLKIISADGDVMAELRDKTKITAVQAVTATHPGVIGRAASGNASGRCVLWSSDD